MRIQKVVGTVIVNVPWLAATALLSVGYTVAGWLASAVALGWMFAIAWHSPEVRYEAPADDSVPEPVSETKRSEGVAT